MGRQTIPTRAISLLQEDALARNIVRLLLLTNKPTPFFGGVGEDWHAGIEFPNTEVKDLSEAGLIYLIGGCKSVNCYIFKKEITERPSTRAPEYMEARFSPNPQLREYLRKLIEPFNDGEPLYNEKQAKNFALQSLV